jgi:hypothetical protein
MQDDGPLLPLNKTGNGLVIVTLRGVRATIVAVESNKYYIFCVCVCVCSRRYPACNALAPCFHKWPVRLYSIFPHYIVNGMISERQKKKLLNIKCVF